MDFPSLLQTAENAAREAGAPLLAGNDEYRQVNAEFARDVKLQADIESEKLIRNLLTVASDFPIIGEEEGGDAELTSRAEPYWVVDPLDGTYNYLRDLPMTCVSIGLCRGETPILGVIYDFCRDELFSGIPGQGLFINGERHRPDWAVGIEKAAIATGFPAGADHSDSALHKLNDLIQRYKKVRMLGSAALAIAYVAAGRVDAYYEESINLWDIAAGMALVLAADGVIRFTPVPGKPLAYNAWAAGRQDLIAAAEE